MEQELKAEIESEKLSAETGQADSQAQEQEQAQILAGEQRARETGWVPKEEFRGDLRKWRDAGSWNEHADRVLPIARANNKKLEEKIATLETALASSKDTLNRITKMQEKFSGDFYHTELSKITTQIEQAVADGDMARYRELRQQEAKLVRPETVKVEESKSEADVIHPEVAHWRADNPWFDPESATPTADVAMTAYVLAVGNQLAKKNDPTCLPGKEKEFCQKITEMVKKEFPHKFSNLNRQRTEIDEPGLRGGEGFSSGNNNRDWNHLPPEAKAQCINIYLKQFPGSTKEDYVRAYPWD